MSPCLLLLLAAQADRPAGSPARSELEQKTELWHTRRLERLTADDGWLTLVGLFWIDGPTATFGSDPKSNFVLPSLPPQLGTFEKKGEDYLFHPAPGVSIMKGGVPFPGGVLQPDAGGPQEVLVSNTVSFHLIRRAERVGVRVRDSQAPARKSFVGISRFPVSERYVVKARLVAWPSPKKISIPTVLGTVEPMDSPGTLVFTFEGKEHSLIPVQEDDGSLFVIFADATSGAETYGAGRFVYTPPPKDGEVLLDFNRAFNPPCAFTSFATCPLPPKGNRLPVRIEAGEKSYQGKH